MHQKLQALARNGYCPGLIYNDETGKWFLSTTGLSPVADCEDRQEDMIWHSFLVPRETQQWYDTPEAAIDAVLVASDH